MTLFDEAIRLLSPLIQAALASFKKKKKMAQSFWNLVLVFVVLACNTAAANEPDQPNIVIILADDLGWNAVGYHNDEVWTPNIDRLCSEGVELTNFHVSPMCSPTRAGLMTGRYPIRYGLARSVIPPWRDFGLSTDEVTLAEALGQAGYGKRGVFGKWHLGHARLKWLPTQRGFTQFTGCLNGAVDYLTLERDGERDWHDNNEPSSASGYATNLIGEAASNFIKQSATDDQPFFCYVPFTAPHSPFQAPENERDRYSHIKNETKRTYYAMISVMDQEIGRILKSIDDAGIRDKTIVWFFSDNGGVAEIQGNNKPLRGAKLTTYEGGVRAVACVRYPKMFPVTQVTEPTAFIDVMPTLMSLAGLKPNDAGCKPLDGLDLTPLLSGRVKELPPRDLYFYHGQSGEDQEPIAVISGRWKLLINGPSLVNGITPEHEVSLFQIANDPIESLDVAAENQATVTALSKQLIEFRKLQPPDGVPPYPEGKKGFVTPKDWSVFND